MEKMTLKVVECRRALVGEGVTALVVAFSKTEIDGDPAVKVLMRLRLPEGATGREAYDLALKYLDPI